MHSAMPLLYTFRRCPYAIRARLALASSGVEAEHQQVVLRDKPMAMLEASPKGTVPVLVLNDGSVIEESLEIMLWALEQNDPEKWLADGFTPDAMMGLIKKNDVEFKYWLDRYKYFERFPDNSQKYYRQQGEQFIGELELLLSKNTFLLGNEVSLADVAIFPFVRQFAHVDKQWFFSSEYSFLLSWLTYFLDGPLFKDVMLKRL